MIEHTFSKAPAAHLSLRVPQELLAKIEEHGRGGALTRSETVRKLLVAALAHHGR